MTRKKVKLAFISNDSARKATYNKREKACAIISNPFSSKTEVWPDLERARQVIERYQNSSVKDETKNVNQESFLLQRITKAREQLQKQSHDSREKEMNNLMIGYMKNRKLPDELCVSELKEFNKLIEKIPKNMDNKIDALG
ncbi:agamous-like MADS-box protein AGL80 [Medicago truncatula]|uniref:MADS-box transcription factor family protein n=1 Tax=Medicago truncatula TaxID=3880 RepID=G7JY84_MEDTR|nr:agamous-like MADS-box protein AGL80 [Medicago truncatula]AES97243.1 MADS-box transcription factor family protein [Medicago truncatula]